MLSDRNPHWVYTQTIKMFAAPASPPFEDEAELERHWGRVRGIDNDVGQIRSILVHRPGPEMAVVDPAKRIPEIGRSAMSSKAGISRVKRRLMCRRCRRSTTSWWRP